jgi:hypothetical protein
MDRNTADELDNQEVHMRRLARRLDLLTGSGDLELRISRRFHAALEDLQGAWDGEAPLGWPDQRAAMFARMRVQGQVIDDLVEAVNAAGGEIDAGAISSSLQQGQERMPFKLNARLYAPNQPVVVMPDELERDFYEFLFSPRQEALLEIDEAIDRMEPRSRRPKR